MIVGVIGEIDEKWGVWGFASLGVFFIYVILDHNRKARQNRNQGVEETVENLSRRLRIVRISTYVAIVAGAASLMLRLLT